MKNKILGSLALLTLTIPLSTEALSKNETVYGKLNSDGSLKNIYVNEHLINNDKLSTIDDYSDLKGIINLNGSETFTSNNTSLTWNALGNDIYYQGKYESELPIKMNITYKLDGNDMNIDDMIGKSGKVGITIKYTNTDKHIVNVNGKNELLYTPFVVTMGTTISNKNTNIEVSNGKIVSNGTSSVIVGISTPGLYESLGLSELKNMDTITITYDTTCFELNTIYSMVTPKLITSTDLSAFDKLNSLYSKVNELQSNMNLIDESTTKVKEGSNLLKTKLGDSINGLSNNNTNALSSEQLTAIKNQTVNTVKSTFTTEYKNNLANTTWNSVKANMSSNDSNVVSYVTNSVSEAVAEYLKSVNEYNDYVACETGKAILSKGGTMTNEQTASCLVIKNDKTLPYVQQAATTSGSKTASNVSSYVAEKISKEVAVTVAETSAINTASTISTSLSNEVANTVKNASISALTSSLTELYNGVTELDNGINQLSDGVSKYNNEGIKKLSTIVNGDVKTTSERIKSLVKLGENYKTISSENNIDGETKFVFVVDSKKYVKPVTVKENTEVKTTFIDRVKNLFKF